MHYYGDNETWQIFDEALEIWSFKAKDHISQNQYTSEQVNEMVCNMAVNMTEEPERGQFSSNFLIVFARHLRLQKMVEGKSVDLPLKAIESLWSIIGNQYNFTLSADVVNKLLDIGIKIRETFKITENDNLKSMAASACRLSKIAEGIIVSKGTLEFDVNFADKIFRYLDDKMLRLGGLEFLANYEGRRRMARLYCEELDRYMICRKDFLGERQKPVHFLLNLAFRHLSAQPLRQWEYQKELHNEIIQVATDFLEVCDLQDESGISYATMKPQELPNYLVNDLFFYKLCIPIQYSSKFILSALEHLIKKWFCEAGLKYSYREYYSLAEYFLKHNWWEEDKHFLSLQEIHNNTGIATYKLKEILKDIAIPTREANKNFISFDSPANFFDYPLFFDLNRGYCCFDRLLCGYGFLTRIDQIIKSRNRNLDSLQGYALEKWLHQEMKNKNYNVKCGCYPAINDLNNGECDCVMESDRLHFIEIKKKSVVKDFNNVDDTSLWGAIGQGMLRAQKQCFAHELYLRTNGSIDFSDGDSIRMDPKKLPALKISVCFGEHLYISSKAYVVILLKTISSNGTIRSVTDGRQNKLNDFNYYAQQILGIVQRQNALIGKNTDISEITCFSLFCSLQQILMAIWNTRDETEFLAIIKEWQYRLDDSLDQYIILFEKLHRKERSPSQFIIDFVNKTKNPGLIVSS